MGVSSSRGVLFGSRKKPKTAAGRAWRGLKGALHIKKAKKKKNIGSLLTPHGWRPKQQKENPFKIRLPSAGEGKRKKSSGSNKARKDSVFKSLSTPWTGGHDEGSVKEKPRKWGFPSSKIPP